MNELKPEDVMKALEHCANMDDCEGCVLFRKGGCIRELTGNALALLREKDAEIERLKAYIQRCKSGEEYWVKCLLERPQEARAEAITEFSELWKKWWYGQIQVAVNEYQESIIYDAIDQIAKEMKRETDEN